jgi:hypothetical protein
MPATTQITETERIFMTAPCLGCDWSSLRFGNGDG